jgi:molybdopterin molybdotransferase
MTDSLRHASVLEARKRVLSLVTPLPAEDRPLAAARGVCLAAPVAASGPMPPFDNAAMDGYAVLAADASGALPPAAVSIATGQRLPDGADAVVPIERVSGGRISGPVRPGDHVRRRGEEFAAGVTLLPTGEPLSPAAIGLLAGMGLEAVRVHRQPRVAVLVSGDELLPIARRAPDELIPDANGPMLGALLAAAGARLTEICCVPDDRETIRAALERLSADADLVCTSGGASVGRPDHLIGLVAELGHLHLHQLAVKPGRPTSFGTVGRTPVVVLPGNPFALLAGFELIARPVVRRLAGAADPFRARVTLAAAEPMPGDAARTLVVAVRVDGSRVRPLAGAGAAMLSGVARADGLAFLPPGGGVPAGRTVEVELWPR